MAVTYTNLGWDTLPTYADGIISEVVIALSSSTVIAREYGLP
jgi:hypothetical protein